MRTGRLGRCRNWHLLAVAALTLGCTGLSHGQRARTLGAEVTQHGASGGVQLHAPDRLGVRLEGLYRRGLTDGIDLQLRAGGNASYCLSGRGEEPDAFGSADAEIGLKFALSPREPRLAVSLAPSLGLTIPWWGTFVRVPLLVGYRWESGHESVLTAAVASGTIGPDLHATISYAHVIKGSNGLFIPELVVGRSIGSGRIFGQVALTVVTGD